MTDRNRTTSTLPVRRYGVTGDLPKLLDRLRTLEDRAAETAGTVHKLERRRAELPEELAGAERDALLAEEDGPDDATERFRELDAAIAAATTRRDGARQAASETRRQVEAELRANGADYRATVREAFAQRRDDALDALGDGAEALSAALEAAATIAALAPVPGRSGVPGMDVNDSQRRSRMDRWRRHELARKLEQVRRELAALDVSDSALDLGPRDTASGVLRVAG